MKHLLVHFILLFSSVLLWGQNQSSSVQRATNAPAERLVADTPKTTVLGNTFIAPKDWAIRIEGPATISRRPRETPGSRLSMFKPRVRTRP